MPELGSSGNIRLVAGAKIQSLTKFDTDTIVRDWFRDPATYFDVTGCENRVLNSHGGTESRTTV
jgi:hypothetical protein